MQILNILAPVFLMIGLGTVLQRTKFVSPGFLKEANRVTYWLGLPALLFSQLAATFHHAGGAGLMFSVMLVATGLLVVAGYLAGWLLRVPGALELKLVLLLMACPTAIVSYTMALEMKGDEALASGTIVLSVFTSLGSLAVILAAF